MDYVFNGLEKVVNVNSCVFFLLYYIGYEGSKYCRKKFIICKCWLCYFNVILVNFIFR